MKALYFECNMGAAGDMLMAALLELHDDPKMFLDRLNAIGIPGVVVSSEPSTKCGIMGTRVKVLVDGCEEGYYSDRRGHDHHQHGGHDHHREDSNHQYNDRDHHRDDHNHQHDSNDHHHEDHTHAHHQKPHDHGEHRHGSYRDIEHVINHLNISDAVKQNALEVYQLIADAESRAHGVPVDKIHFHELGEMDAVADIVGVCMLIDELSPDIIRSSPINTGCGQIQGAHGILPGPAPATAHILRDVPIYSDSSVGEGELCTPTGAALLKRFAKKFCEMPTITVSKIGYGIGSRDLGRANCVRAYIGSVAGGVNEEVVELECNLDDMTPEAVAFTHEQLLREGALDVWTTPAGMKKGRPGINITCLCTDETKEKMVALIFKHTTTLGIRESAVRRYTLQREHAELQTIHGPVRIKKAHGFGVKNQNRNTKT
jgi:uncharacterized protein (TIGR00299 family) protein